MAGTQAGGKQAARTNKIRYGKSFYAKIGAKGGKKGHTGGFYANREAASYYGAIGGTMSRKGIRLNADEKRRMRAKVERNYQHLLRVNKAAEKQRRAVVQSA